MLDQAAEAFPEKPLIRRQFAADADAADADADADAIVDRMMRQTELENEEKTQKVTRPQVEEFFMLVDRLMPTL